MSVQVEVYVHFGSLVAPEATVLLQRSLGDRLRLPCQRLQSEDGQQVYVVVLLDHTGTVSDACRVVEHEIQRWVADNAITGSVRVERVHAFRAG